MRLRITVEGVAYDVDVQVLDGTAAAPVAVVAAPPVAAPAPTLTPAAPPPPPTAAEPTDVKSPIAGNVMSITVKPGDTVAANDTLLVLEAMKMESNVVAPAAGTVQEVCVSVGDAVTTGQILMRTG